MFRVTEKISIRNKIRILIFILFYYDANSSLWRNFMNKLKLRDENGKIYYGWYILILSALVGTFIYNGIISTTGIFLLPVTEDLELSMGGFSLYVSILSVMNILTLFVFSSKINKFNIKKIMIITALIGALSYVGFALSTSLWHFYVLAVPMGICFGACTMTPCTILVSNWFGPKVRGKAMSFYMAAVSLIGMGFVNCINYIVVSLGWRTGYMILGIMMAICVLPMLKLIVWSPEEKGIACMGAGEEEVQISEDKSGFTFKEGMKKPIVWAVLISCALLTLASSADLQHSVATYVMAGFTATKAVFLNSIIQGVMIISTVLVGNMVDRFGIRIGTLFTGALFTLVFLSYAYLDAVPWLVYPVILFYSFGIPIVNLISPLIMAHVCGEKDLPKFIGYVNIFIGIGVIFGAPLVGTLFDITGAYRIPWLIMTFIVLLVTIIRVICTSKKNQFKEELAELSA